MTFLQVKPAAGELETVYVTALLPILGNVKLGLEIPEASTVPLLKKSHIKLVTVLPFPFDAFSMCDGEPRQTESDVNDAVGIAYTLTTLTTLLMQLWLVVAVNVTLYVAFIFPPNTYV